MTTETTRNYEVAVRASGISFGCIPGQTVLEAAEQAGWRIPYSCRKGVCSTCEGSLTRGDVDVRGRGAMAGPAHGVRLCQTRPCGDVEIVPTQLERRGPPQRKALTARVFRMWTPTPEVTILRLRFPIGRRAPFRAGQYVRVRLGDEDSRNFSMANAPQDNGGIELHVRRIPGGRFSEHFLGNLDLDDTLEVELPYGEFCIDDDSDQPIILVATGTGFAPVQSILLDHLRRRLQRPLHLYWGGRRRSDLYRAGWATALAARASWFSFTPVLSDPDSDWTGRNGFVHHAVLKDYPDLSGHKVYACGNPAMVTQAGNDLTAEAGLARDDYYSDAFVSSAEPTDSVPLPTPSAGAVN